MDLREYGDFPEECPKCGAPHPIRGGLYEKDKPTWGWSQFDIKGSGRRRPPIGQADEEWLEYHCYDCDYPILTKTKDAKK